MKKLLLAPLLLFVFIINTNAQFRGLEWGSTEKDAISKYGKPDLEGEGYIAYEYTLSGKSTLSAFYYVQNKLYSGVYLLTETHSNKNGYIDDYNDFKNLLSKKYGDPEKDETVWKNDLYQDDYSSWGMAISVGHLVKYSTWSNEKTNIECSITGDNYEITCKIRYDSIELKDWVKKIKEEEKLDDF